MNLDGVFPLTCCWLIFVLLNGKCICRHKDTSPMDPMRYGGLIVVIIGPAGREGVCSDASLDQA